MKSTELCNIFDLVITNTKHTQLTFPPLAKMCGSLFLNVLFLQSFALAQINTESYRPESNFEGIKTQADAQLAFSNGNTDFFRWSSSLRLDIQKKNVAFFTVGSISQGEANGSRFQNAGFLHLRGIYRMTHQWEWEAYSQLEFNDFIDLQRRNLLGGDIRWLPFANKDDLKQILSLAIGIGAMHEWEFFNRSIPQRTRIWRSSNYITFAIMPNATITFEGVGYYQRDLFTQGDFRILFEGGLSFTITEQLRYFTRINYRYDNEPPLPELALFDLSVNNGIQVRF